MTPATYFEPLLGQSLLYPGQALKYKGQCVQPVMYWIREQGIEPPVYPSAYMYYERGVIGYTKIPVGSPIQDGDIVVYGSSFPPANGDGHIDVATGSGTSKDYWAYDSNWSLLILTKTHHNGSDNNYIIGYLRRDNMAEMTQSAAEKVVTYLYRLGTGDYPNPGQAEYWVPRVKDVPTGVDELGTAMLEAQKPAEYKNVGSINNVTIYEKV